MSSVTLEIREDVSHPEGGHAIIVIKGLQSKPDNGAFAIEPADTTLAARDMKGWPVGARRPLKTTMSATGFEIVVGPDVVECPVLLPGTPVIVKVPAAGISLEALWPDITPLRRKKVKRIITSTERRDALARAQSNVTSIDVASRSAPDETASGSNRAVDETTARPTSAQSAKTAPELDGNLAKLATQSAPASAVEKLISGQVGQPSPQANEPADLSLLDTSSAADMEPASAAKIKSAPAAEIQQEPAADMKNEIAAREKSDKAPQPPKTIGNLSKLNMAAVAGKTAAELPSGNDNHLPQTQLNPPPSNNVKTTGAKSVSSRGMAPKAVAQLAVKSSTIPPKTTKPTKGNDDTSRDGKLPSASPKQQEDMLVAALSSQSDDHVKLAPGEPAPVLKKPVVTKAPITVESPSASNGPGLPKQPLNQSKIVAKKKPVVVRKSVGQGSVGAPAKPAGAVKPMALHAGNGTAIQQKSVPPAPAKAPAHNKALIQAHSERRTQVALHRDAEQPVPQVRELRAERPSRRWRKDGWLSGLASGVLATVVAMFAYVSLLGWPNLSVLGLPSTMSAGTFSQNGEGLAIYDALKVGTVSPRGISASSIDGDAAIARADGALRIGNNSVARDTDEGAFWFKQYLARQIGDKRTIWAMTQLGTTYANPVEGAPDYKKAQVLWEAAAALGDPYAACFLGQLYENGLGVASSRNLALTWYLRARSAGGCQMLNRSIARLGG